MARVDSPRTSSSGMRRLVFIALKMIGEYFDYHVDRFFALCRRVATRARRSGLVAAGKKRKDDGT